MRATTSTSAALFTSKCKFLYKLELKDFLLPKSKDIREKIWKERLATPRDRQFTMMSLSIFFIMKLICLQRPQTPDNTRKPIVLLTTYHLLNLPAQKFLLAYTPLNGSNTLHAPISHWDCQEAAELGPLPPPGASVNTIQIY